MTKQEAIKFGEMYLEMNEDSKDQDGLNTGNNKLVYLNNVISLIRSMYPSSPILPSNRRKWEKK